MQYRKVKFIAALMWVLITQTTARADTPIIGIGSNSCSQFAQDYKDSETAESGYFGWAQGFMSGFNGSLMWSKQPTRDLGSTSLKEQQIRIRLYCDQHPLNAYMQPPWKIPIRGNAF
jgi:hypothetical protein